MGHIIWDIKQRDNMSEAIQSMITYKTVSLHGGHVRV